MIEVHPVLGGPSGGFGPHFRIQDGNMFRDYGHPKGKSYQSCCHQDGDYFYKGFFDCDDLYKVGSSTPIFVQRGDYIWTEKGHPDGRGHYYYELRRNNTLLSIAEKREKQAQKRDVTKKQIQSATKNPGSTTVSYRATRSIGIDPNKDFLWVMVLIIALTIPFSLFGYYFSMPYAVHHATAIKMFGVIITALCVYSPVTFFSFLFLVSKQEGLENAKSHILSGSVVSLITAIWYFCVFYLSDWNYYNTNHQWHLLGHTGFMGMNFYMVYVLIVFVFSQLVRKMKSRSMGQNS